MRRFHSAVLLSALLLTGLFSLESCTPKVAPIKVLTFNIEGPSATKPTSIGYWPNRRDGVIEMIREADFDLMGTQENSREMLGDLVTALPQYKWIGAFRAASPSVNAIIYKTDRFELLESGHFYYSPTPDVDFTYFEDDSSHKDLNCIWAKFKDRETGVEFYHFNSHIHAFHSSEMRDTLRCRDARILKEKVASIAGSYPAFCTGDFNCSETCHNNQTGEVVFEDQPGYVELMKGGILLDVRPLAEKKVNEECSSLPGWLGTFPTANDRKYDHIFLSSLYSGKYKVLEYEVIDASGEMTHQGTVTTMKPLLDLKNGDTFTAGYSDHRPVTATILFKE